MKERKTKKIDFSHKRLGAQADKYYNEGRYLSALRLAYRQYELYGGDGDVYTRLADIYEGMGLHASANSWWYKFLDIASEEDLPDIYEGLAVNYLNMGQDSASAYYYNRLIDVDDQLSNESKMEIIGAFAKDKRAGFRFVYPPKIADYTKEVDYGSRALKAGDTKRAINILSRVEKGSKEYAEAKEMQAVAYLLDGDVQNAKDACQEILQENPDDIRTQATLAAVYLEEGKNEESLAIAWKLYAQKQDSVDDLYKVATVCCENGLHEQAYEKFCALEEKIPFEGRMLYFKAVSAYKCGRIEEAEKAFDMLCTVYPDAEVAKYYLKALRLRGEEDAPSMEEINYFYHIPQAEREARCRYLVHMGRCSKDEAPIFGLIASHDRYFQWCFDEMDGTDHDLQYLAIVSAEHVGADDFLREIMLDADVADVLKVETLRLLYMRNEETEMGVVLCHIYRKLLLLPIKLGRKRRKKFLEAYAKVASKFVVVSDRHGLRIQQSAEKLYRALERYNALDLMDNSDDCACAIFLASGLKELGADVDKIAEAFDANPAKVRVLLTYLESKKLEEKEQENETH